MHFLSFSTTARVGRKTSFPALLGQQRQRLGGNLHDNGRCPTFVYLQLSRLLSWPNRGSHFSFNLKSISDFWKNDRLIFWFRTKLSLSFLFSRLKVITKLWVVTTFHLDGNFQDFRFIGHAGNLGPRFWCFVSIWGPRQMKLQIIWVLIFRISNPIDIWHASEGKAPTQKNILIFFFYFI